MSLSLQSSTQSATALSSQGMRGYLAQGTLAQTKLAQAKLAQAGQGQSHAGLGNLDQAKLHQACRMFESNFLQMLWKEMRATVPKGGIINGGFAEEMFTGMLDQARADKAVAGRSMGLAA